MSVIPDALRSTIVSSPLGDLTFTPSVGAVLYYEARVYVAGTTTPLIATKYLGVPSADPITNLIKVNLFTMLNALPAGNYDVAVAAVDGGGATEATSNDFTVPLS